jgi:hypothetical protein
MNFPVWCACGKLVTFSNETRCEDCYAAEMGRLRIPGRGNPKNLNIDTTIAARRDEDECPISRSRLLRSGDH